MLHIARLTDHPGSGDRKNLSVKQLPELVEEENLRKKIDCLICSANKATEFCRVWRN